MVQFTCAVRKTDGAAASASFGLNLNTTQVRAVFAHTSAGAEEDNGIINVMFYANVATYLAGALYTTASRMVAPTQTRFGANGPAATITSIIIRGLVGNTLITGAADELHVYRFAPS